MQTVKMTMSDEMEQARPLATTMWRQLKEL